MSMPRVVKAIVKSDSEQAFWLAIRQALTIVVAAIERRYLPNLKKVNGHTNDNRV